MLIGTMLETVYIGVTVPLIIGTRVNFEKQRVACFLRQFLFKEIILLN